MPDANPNPTGALRVLLQKKLSRLPRPKRLFRRMASATLAVEPTARPRGTTAARASGACGNFDRRPPANMQQAAAPASKAKVKLTTRRAMQKSGRKPSTAGKIKAAAEPDEAPDCGGAPKAAGALLGPFSLPLDITLLPTPAYATSKATSALSKELMALVESMSDGASGTPFAWIDVDRAGDNLYQWIVHIPRSAFDETIPLANDMRARDVDSVVVEMVFPEVRADYKCSPPFVRILYPRFLRFLYGGGGHVTAGGTMCLQMLTSSGWDPACTPLAVLLHVKLALESADPVPARLDVCDWDVPYTWQEAADAFVRVSRTHGWSVSGAFGGLRSEVEKHLDE
ncbi:MAG: hypothetical protein BJ554DRAFT_6263 [Olpidium bornovanus]|uniref:UBC core domain-containing protein n=1 Tax=Olpidium bornovanus TaxID=278681 RepID=A0A8H8DKU1_9FUNG|nr:MAG: hypothetical protein BJ554DRAFT_6263 [Olpidium bornovanus]